MGPDELSECVRYAALALRPSLGDTLTPSMVEEVTSDFVEFAGRSAPLLRHENGIVSILKPMTAALCADRVWLTMPGADPRLDFGFGWTCPMAARFAAAHAFMQLTGSYAEYAAEHAADDATPKGEIAEFISTTELELSRAYASVTGAAVMPLYASAREREAEYQPGNCPVVVGVIENVAVVAEEHLTWEAVLDFRADGDARTAYRRFIHWLDKEMVGRSESFIADAIAERMEQYHQALRKHGLRTVTGALESCMDPKGILGGSAIALTLESLANQPLLAVLSGTGVLIGRSAVSVATKLIERQEIIADHGNIAFVQEVRDRVTELQA